MRLHTSVVSWTRHATWVAWFGLFSVTSCTEADHASKVDVPDVIAPEVRPTADLDQCGNGPLQAPVSCSQSKNWVHGDLDATRSHYVEGEVIPYRVRFGSLEPGRMPHTVLIAWDTVVSDRTEHHALDRLASFDRTERRANPCAGVSGCTRDLVSRFAVPIHESVTAGPDGLAGTADDLSVEPGIFELYGGAILDVSPPAVRHEGRASTTSVVVTFTSSVTNPVLVFGGHVAERRAWAPEPTATLLPGNPYRTRILALDGRDAFEERTLCAQAVHALPELVVEKRVINDNGGTATPGDFTLRVVGGNPVPASFPGADRPGTVVTFQPGAYSVTEDADLDYDATYEGDCVGEADYDETLYCLVTNDDVDGCTNRVCDPPAGECLEAGVCNPQTGACEYAPKAVGTVCRGDANVCTLDVCDALGMCTHPPGRAGVTCREAAGECDVAEQCDGLSRWCPADTFAPSEVVCRAAAGVCDAPETCSGTSARCPDDTKHQTPCRVSVGMCDLTETCDGESDDCPPDGFVPATVECRASAGACDVSEACTGAAADCPADAKSHAVCRAAGGVCDVSEVCDGIADACPSDGFVPFATECRAAAGVCDTPEACTGAGAACPGDQFLAATTECRAAAGVCDAPEACTGAGAACPDDQFLPATTECRAAAGMCDTPEACTGEGAACPDDGVKAFGTECRPSAGVCDFAEDCDGRSAQCPADGFHRTTALCRAARGACDVAEWCTGNSPACPDDALAPVGTECRAAAGTCDVPEACRGEDACPPDAFLPGGTPCRASTDACDPAELCAGDAAACPEDVSAACTLCGTKVYDADADGAFDANDVAIPGWQFTLSAGGTVATAVTDGDGAYVFAGLAEGDYVVCEVMPGEANWLVTSPFERECRTVHVPSADGEACTLDFANVCLGGGGARSPGFWSSPNGEDAFERHDHGQSALCMLRALDLWNAGGHAFNPWSYCEFKAWLVARTSVNMAYQLSAQLAAMKLNVLVGYVEVDALVHAPGLEAASPLGFATIGDVLAEAERELEQHGYTPAGSAYRAYQELLEAVLAAANNDLGFVQSTPCSFDYAPPGGEDLSGL